MCIRDRDVVGNIKLNGNLVTGSGAGGLQGNVYAASGISTFNDVLVNGNLTVEGDTTTLNTTLRNVELLRVSAASTLSAGIITQTSTGDILRLYDSASEVFKVADGGVTQIIKGTSGGAAANTDAPLILDNSSNSYIQFRTPATKEQGLLFGDDADNNAGYIAYNHSTNALAIGVNADEKVRIISGGQVAIGTTVEGTVAADELTLSGSGSVGMTIRSTNSTESNIFMSDATTGSGEYAGWIKFKHNTTPNRWEFGAVNSQILIFLLMVKLEFQLILEMV